MKEVLTYLGLVLADKVIASADLTVRCLLIALNGATFITEKPFYQQLILEGQPTSRSKTLRPRDADRGKKMYERIRKLEKYGFIEKQRRGNRFWYVLTSKGELRLLKKSIKFAPRFKSNTRIFISYDIPEDFKHIRELFRNFLYETGFQQFHKSIFMCDREVGACLIQFIKLHKLEPWVRIIKGTIL